MSNPTGGSTLSYLARQAQLRAKTAMALKISPEPTAAPLKPAQPAQPAKIDISPDEEMLAAVRQFLERF